MSSIISNLITVFPRSVLTAVPSELFASFVNCLTHLTCSFGRSAALEEAVSDGPWPLRGCSRRPACRCLWEHVFWQSGNVTFKHSWIKIILVDYMDWSRDFDLEIIWHLNVGNGMKCVLKGHFNNENFKGCC